MVFTACLIGVALTLVVVYSFRHTLFTCTLPDLTIQRVVDQILEQSETIAQIQSPRVAYIQSRECQARLQILIDIVGGQTILDSLCGINTARLQNILHTQETQIVQHIDRAT